MSRSENRTGAPRRSAGVAVHAALAALCWLPLLLTAPGRVAADTRAHLYLDPGEFLSRARSLWDPLVHMGTVTHQNLGLAVPMGTWYWLVDALDVPMWVGQRLWVGAILFAAAAGVLHLGRTMGWALAGSTTSAVAYALSPYVLQYATRTSVLLLPFAGLPWMLSLVVRATRAGGWRHPAAFALVVGLVGSVNATSLILVGLAPVLWVVHAAATRDVTPGRALATAARCGILSLGTGAWWIAGLWVQARHGLPVLTYTETIDQVSTTSAAPEVLRGLGYWVFYGREVLDPNVGAAVAYTQNPALLALTYLLPAAGLVAAFTSRFRHRAFFVLLTAVGTVVAVGAYPVADPSISASLFRDAADSTAGLAMRSSTRAVPLVALGLAVFLGRGVDALPVRRPARWGVVGAAALASVLALPALLTGGFVDANFSRPEELPDHWTQAAAFLDDAPGDGAVLELPGIQFATYRWGTTYEPVSPALLDRPVIAREQLPYGSPASADLLIALDRRLQEGVTEPESLVTLARMMGAEWILLRNDLAFERYVSARPARLWDDLHPLPDGLTEAASFGEGVPNEPDPRIPLLDEEALSLPPDADQPAAIELLAVDEPLDRLRIEPVGGGTVLAGDGEGIVDAAAAGLLRADAPLLYGATVVDRPELLADALDTGASIVVTDTARKRERRWRSVRWSTGYTERADEELAPADLGEGDLQVFDDPPAGSMTTVTQSGGTVDASTYGGPFTLDPDVRPAFAADGRTDTAWVVGPVTDPVGAWLRLRPDAPVTTDHVTVVQRQAPSSTNRITALDVRTDDGEPLRVELDERSLSPGGQRIELGADRSVAAVEVTVAATQVPPQRGGTPVGLAELRLGDVTVEETVVLPTAVLDAAAGRADRAPLAYVLTRLRSDPAEPVRGDEEPTIRRRFTVPSTRDFELSGEARLSADAPADAVAALVGITSPLATSSSVLPGSPANRAFAAVDGDPTTAWRPAFPDVEGPWLQVRTTAPATIEDLDLTLVADGDHSVPTQLELTVDGASQLVDLPLVERGTERGAVREVSVPVEPVTGSEIRVTVTSARGRATTEYYSGARVTTPVGIAEIGLPGVAPAAPAAVDTGCRDDLVAIDGTAVPVTVQGAADRAVTGQALEVRACGPVHLVPGDHEVEATDGALTGLDLDRLVVRSAGAPPAPAPGDGPPLLRDPETNSTTGYRATLGAGGEAWLVLAQSHGHGWEASVAGEDLGAPVLIDGGFNGWRLPAGGTDRALTVEWEPQRTVDRAIVASLVAAVLALVVVTLGSRGARAWASDEDTALVAGWASAPTPWQPAMAGYVLVPAAFGLLVVGPAGALAAAAATLLALRRPLGRVLAAAAAVGCWLVAAGTVVVGQVVDPRRPDFEWADGLRTPHWWAMTAVVVLVAVVAAELLRSRRPVTAQQREEAERATAHLAAVARSSPLGRGFRALQSRGAAGRSGRAGTGGARRFFAASAVGGLVATLLFTWMLTAGGTGLTDWQRVGDFYDGQAESLLEGRWDIAPETLGIERFEARGRSYMYQGPWPALLRLPVAAVTDRFEGRLTQSSMLLGFVVALTASVGLHWRIRRLVRGSAPVSRREAAAVGVATFAVSGGSALLFLASRAWAYHEAAMWGTAWAIVALWAVLAFVTEPTRRRLAGATLATTLALWSRSSVGIGPLAALAMVAGGNVLVHVDSLLRARAPDAGWARFLGRQVARLRWTGSAPDPSGRVPVLGPVVAAVAPLGAYAAVNWIKFRTLFSIPFSSQGFTLVDEQRRAMLAENGGTLFGLHFSPTTLVQYLRPDALSVTRTFPFVDFAAPAEPIGDVTFDLIDRSTSIPVSMTVLFVLTVVAAVASARRASSIPGQGLAALRVPLLGGLAGALTIIPFGYIANRYLADAVPLLVVGGLAGLQVVAGRFDHRTAPPSGRRRTALAALGVGVAAATWINGSLGLSYQRLYSPNVKDDVIASYLDTTFDLSQMLGLDPDIPIATGDRLPETAPRGSLFAVDGCEGLYLSDGMDVNAIKITPWNAVERTEEGGRFLRRVTFPDQPPGTREPLLSVEAPDGRTGLLYAEWRGGAGIAFGYVQDEPDGSQIQEVSPTRLVPPGETFTLDLVADHHVRNLVVWLDGRIVLEIYLELDVDAVNVVGRNTTDREDVAPAFTGTLAPLPERSGVCEELVAEAAEG